MNNIRFVTNVPKCHRAKIETAANLCGISENIIIRDDAYTMHMKHLPGEISVFADSVSDEDLARFNNACIMLWQKTIEGLKKKGYDFSEAPFDLLYHNVSYGVSMESISDFAKNWKSYPSVSQGDTLPLTPDYFLGLLEATRNGREDEYLFEICSGETIQTQKISVEV